MLSYTIPNAYSTKLIYYITQNIASLIQHQFDECKVAFSLW